MKRSKEAEAQAKRAATAAAAGGLSAPKPGELRIAVDKKAYAEIIGHAVVEPDVEVCGVLVGRLDQDAHGSFVRVDAVIRGEAAKEQGAAVTFTHDTWNHIHGEMDRRFKDDQIVGWYHTHGGFGVFLSDMDVFVHDNFFPEPHHVAYVYDPLAGSEAFFQRTKDGLEPARRYWVGGRERRPAMRLPETSPPQPGTAAPPGIERLERAVAALQSSVEERSSVMTWLPWLLAAGVAVMQLVEWRGGSAARGQSSQVVAVVTDPITGQVTGVPLEDLEPLLGRAFRDRQGNVRAGLLVQGSDGVPVLRLAPPPSEADLARERQVLEAASAERSALLRMVAKVAGAALLVAAVLAGAWYLLTRRR
jgi:proteasome lid subunit RPN8/RPN11